MTPGLSTDSPAWRSLPCRGFAEAAVITMLFTGALWLERVPWPALLVLPPLALGVGCASALRHRDPRPRRVAVALSRVASWWYAIFCVPLAGLLAWRIGVGALLLLPVSLVLAPVGTLLLRERRDVAGSVVKAVTLLPGAAAGLAAPWPWFCALGAATLLLCVSLLVATVGAHRADPLPLDR